MAHPTVRRSFLSLVVAAALCVPVSAAVMRVRSAHSASQRMTQSVDRLDHALAQWHELNELPVATLRAELLSLRDSAAGETLSQQARALTQVCDALDALHRGEYTTAHQSADAALRMVPDEPHALLVLAAASAGRGDRVAAERSVERLRRLRNVPPPVLRRAAFLRAEWLLDAGRSHDALEALEALNREQPSVGPVLNLLGLARGAVGDRVGSRSALEQAIATHGHPEIPLLNLARVQREAGQLTEARATLERALGASPEYAEAWVALGVILAEMGAPNARHVLVRAAQLSPSDATPLAAQGSLDLASGQYERAAESFRQALARDPDHAIARTNLGITLAHLGRTDLALRAFEQATTHSPHVGEAWNGLGSMRLSAGNAEAAVGPLRQAMTLLPEDPNPAINLGRALEALQQWDAAGRAYHEALRRQPGHAAAIDRLLAITPPADRDRERQRLGLPSIRSRAEHRPRHRATQGVGSDARSHHG
ncbi:MAG: tetratricopeptide repeat protein [Deltaproteobacteria bacterium]|nr:tetratricopeptide repeat protein [Deltaproteobacteria bacterium]